MLRGAAALTLFEQQVGEIEHVTAVAQPGEFVHQAEPEYFFMLMMQAHQDQHEAANQDKDDKDQQRNAYRQPLHHDPLLGCFSM